MAIRLRGFSFQPSPIQLFQEGANNFRQNLNLYGNQQRSWSKKMPSYNLNNVFQYFLTVILPAMLWCSDFTLCQKSGTSHLSQNFRNHDIQNLILIPHHLSYQLFYLNLPIWKSVFIFKKEKRKKIWAKILLASCKTSYPSSTFVVNKLHR